jgi:hypothetical protein
MPGHGNARFSITSGDDAEADLNSTNTWISNVEDNFASSPGSIKRREHMARKQKDDAWNTQNLAPHSAVHGDSIRAETHGFRLHDDGIDDDNTHMHMRHSNGYDAIGSSSTQGRGASAPRLSEQQRQRRSHANFIPATASTSDSRPRTSGQESSSSGMQTRRLIRGSSSNGRRTLGTHHAFVRNTPSRLGRARAQSGGEVAADMVPDDNEVCMCVCVCAYLCMCIVVYTCKDWWRDERMRVVCVCVYSCIMV